LIQSIENIFNGTNTKGDNMEDVKLDFNDAESANSMVMTARERICQRGLHRVCFDSYNLNEFEFAHSIINKDVDLLEKSNDDGFNFTQKLEAEIIARFCNDVMKTGDVDQFRLMNHWTLKLAVAIECEIIAAKRICLQRNVLTISNVFIFELFEIALRIRKFGFILCCNPTGEINSMVMLDEYESIKSFPQLHGRKKDECVGCCFEFRLDDRLDESLTNWTEFKNSMKSEKSV
jgi:hypothetical protein